MRTDAKPRTYAVLALIVVLSTAIRLSTIFAAYPYINYMDAGYVLHSSLHMTKHATFDPGWYGYPPLVMDVQYMAFNAYAPAYKAVHGTSLRDDIVGSEPGGYYDLAGPPDTLIIGRLITVAFAAGTVMLAYLIGAELWGAYAGLLAALIMGLLPAHLIRSSIILTDTPMAFFTTAALYFSILLAKGRKTSHAVLAGVSAGLAASTKYNAVLVGLPMVAWLVFWGGSLKARAKNAAVVLVTAAAAFVAACPTAITKPGALIDAIGWQRTFYSSMFALRSSATDYMADLLSPAEAGPLFLAAAAACAVLVLTDRESRKHGAVLLVFVLFYFWFMSMMPFQPLRNLSPLYPVLCLFVSAGIIAAYGRTGRLASAARVTAVAVTLFILAGFIYVDAVYIKTRATLTDSRAEFVEWVEKGIPSARYAVANEIALLPSEAQRVSGRLRFFDVKDTRAVIAEKDADYIVLPVFKLDYLEGGIPECVLYSNYISLTSPHLKSFGRYNILPQPYFWRNNEMLINVIPLKTGGGPENAGNL